ncbi:hypothetical protein NOF04DRAFT_9462 [Fusarium oxysporum II5]|uniref:Transcription factor domain-containing protein n=1 Tax=Fusarium odoratissimum (strain NRRL 54006) TaxID=1089451 RepID=X0JKF9_FUSO5|nr:uncharacterized protein FOIG_11149 [Fusarium odoratissimum NRRL 54006]EXL96790.1 hypothetical protein FOIG_11149 [Fusarium odoratissimum NRRL 54006]KAK2136057.1 hypothetical protein NOF04DRAFT_9462 [Fusarium oxysporum II5]
MQDEREQWRTICKTRCDKRITPLPASLSANLLDPFQSLAVDSKRLHILLNDFNARQAPEPVFSVEDDFQNFQSVFRSGLVDPALLNAVMLSLAFTANGGVINKECLVYRGQAMQHIRERISMPDKAVSESTIGAILLLVGVEARLGTTSQVQLHMGAIQYLLNACQPVVVNLTQGIKRAIFWYDLNSSIMVGSKRIVDHTTFTELQWQRDSIAPDFFELPPGFQVRSHLFSPEFLDIVRDIHALQCIRNIYQRTGRPVSTVSINSHTASIQSRLQALPNACPISKACHLAAYMCSVMLCCKVWCALVIPSNITAQLLREVEMVHDEPVWNEHADLLLWLICIGGVFAPDGPVRSGYTALLRSTGFERPSLHCSWSDTSEILNQFIWSDLAFESAVRKFLEESSMRF